MRGIPQFNFPAFFEAEAALQAAHHETFNPARHDTEDGFDLTEYDGTESLADIGLNLRDALSADLTWITLNADGIAVLSGWTESLGAVAEVAVAGALGLPVYSVDYWVGVGQGAEMLTPTPLGEYLSVIDDYTRDLAAVTATPPLFILQDKYRPAIGDRVRIVDGDYLRGDERIGTVTNLDATQYGWPRPHPIRVVDDDGLQWYAVEVELISTAAEEAGFHAWAAGEDAAYIASQSGSLPEYPTPETRTIRAMGLAAIAEKGLRQKFICGVDPTSDHAWVGEHGPEPVRFRRGGVVVSNEERVTSETGGQKGRKLAELGGIDPQALLTLAEVSGMGTRKYSAFNYLKGYDWSLSFNAMQRHALAFWAGQDNDDESGLPHVAHAAWHCLALLAFLQREIGTDDRFNQERGVAV